MILFVRIWLFSLIAKLALALWLPLSPDEAYYWVWSKHFQLSYYDHPPMIAHLFALGDLLPNWGQALRWPAILMGHLSLLIWRDILRPHLSESQLISWLGLMLALPLVGPGSLIVTPDLPLLFFWSLSLWLFQKWSTQPDQVRWTLALGLSLGLGFLSKYTAVLIVPILVFWAWKRKLLAPLCRRIPEMALMAILASWPLWLWNIQTDFASFRFQLHHGLGRPAWKPSWTIEYLAGQFALYLPLGFFLFTRRPAKGLPSFLQFAAIFPLAFFFFTTFRGYAEANWPLMAGAPMVAMALTHPRFTKRWIFLTQAFWLLGLVIVLAGLALVPDARWIKRSKLAELRRYSQVKQLALQHRPLFVRSYQMAAKLSYETGTQIYKLKGMNRVDFYDFRPESQPQGPRFFLLREVDDEIPEPWSKWSVTPVESVDDGLQLLEIESR